MSVKDKIIKELRSILLTSIYFFSWFGVLMVIKILLLKEYHVHFVGLTIVIIAALVLAKVVLILEIVPMPFTKGKPAWVEVTVRTLLYMVGVFIVIALEKSIEARHEYDGVFDAFTNLISKTDEYQIWVNTILIFGALLFFNIWSVVKMHYGAGIFRKLMMSPLPDKKAE
jgi:hypothetical protein